MEVQTHIDALRSLLMQGDDWSNRYSSRHTRSVCMRLFNCHVEGYESMSNEAFALAMISQNGNSLCCVPEDVWQAVKEEATKMLTLQMVAGTFPPPKPNKQFSLVVNDENELPGWQPLTLLLAKGYERLKYWVDYYEGGRTEHALYGFPVTGIRNRRSQLDSEEITDESMPWNPHDWISAESMVIDSGSSSCQLEIDIMSLKMKVEGHVNKPVRFSGSVRLTGTGDGDFAVEDIITDAYNRGVANVSIG